MHLVALIEEIACPALSVVWSIEPEGTGGAAPREEDQRVWFGGPFGGGQLLDVHLIGEDGSVCGLVEDILAAGPED